MNKLIERARNLQMKVLAEKQLQEPTHEEVELYLAVFDGTVQMTAAAKSLGQNAQAFYARWYQICRQLHQKGHLKLDI